MVYKQTEKLKKTHKTKDGRKGKSVLFAQVVCQLYRDLRLGDGMQGHQGQAMVSSVKERSGQFCKESGKHPERSKG